MTQNDHADDSRRAQRLRVWIFVAVCAVAVTAVGFAVARAMLTTRQAARTVDGTPIALLPGPPARPFVLFRSLIPGDTWSRVGVAPLSSPNGPRYLSALTCETVYFSGNRGVCLATEDAPLPKYYASIFDDQFRPVHKIALTGVPSRVRVSRDGRRAAVTVFEHGHSYAESGFSTRTTIIDTANGASLGTLEDFSVMRDGKRFQQVDFNFWGVTFAQDGQRFFATLSSGGTPYLIEGSLDRREARVIAPGVECPSLSPDDKRIVFKKRVQQGIGWEWRLWLLDLGTMAERALAESRAINDQVDWLDNAHVLYQDSSAEGTDIWVLGTEGTEGPQRFVHNAFSPAVVR
jgi:hypothetical protein